MNLYCFNLFIQGFMKQFESERLEILLLLFVKSNLHHVGNIIILAANFCEQVYDC